MWRRNLLARGALIAKVATVHWKKFLTFYDLFSIFDDFLLNIYFLKYQINEFFITISVKPMNFKNYIHQIPGGALPPSPWPGGGSSPGAPPYSTPMTDNTEASSCSSCFLHSFKDMSREGKLSSVNYFKNTII